MASGGFAPWHQRLVCGRTIRRPSSVACSRDVADTRDGLQPAASKHANQSRRLLSIAAVLDGMSRADAARIGGMDRQTLRDWVYRFNADGPEGLLDSWSKGPEPRLSNEQRAEIADLVATGRTRPCTAWYAGVGSTCSASFSSGSG